MSYKLDERLAARKPDDRLSYRLGYDDGYKKVPIFDLSSHSLAYCEGYHQGRQDAKDG